MKKNLGHASDSFYLEIHTKLLYFLLSSYETSLSLVITRYSAPSFMCYATGAESAPDENISAPLELKPPPGKKKSWIRLLYCVKKVKSS